MNIMPVIDMTATENENMVEISAKELSDLQESNANLIAEREGLMEKVSTLEKKLKEEHGQIRQFLDNKIGSKFGFVPLCIY